MFQRRLWPALLLAVALSVATGCQKQETANPSAPAPTLELVRKHASLALDNSAPSGQRGQAREDTMTTLAAFLRLPESVKVSKADWEKPLQAGAAPLIRYYESGRVRVYAVTLPGSGIVPPGERVAVQYVPPSGPPVATEVTLMPGGRLAAARALEESGQVYLTLAAAVGSGDGGFVAHFQRDSRGEFKLYPTVFKALPANVGNVAFEVKDGFLLVSGAAAGTEAWQPYFDGKRPLRLYLNGDLGLEWKNGFSVLDERNFNAFQGLSVALNAKANKDDRTEAWEKATRKLPDYLRDIESWTDDLSSKLPPGGRAQKEQMSNLAVRVVSIPAPDFAKELGFTVVQQRASGGMPSAQVLPVPGVMEAFRLVDHQGLPALLIFSESTPREQKGEPVRQKSVSLFRLTAGNTWEPAPDYFGFLPAPAGLKIELPAGAAGLNIQWAASASAQVSLDLAGPPAAKVCPPGGDCFSLAFTPGGRLSGAGWVQGALRRVSGGKPVSGADMTLAAAAVQQFLPSPDAQGLSVTALAQALGAGQGIDVAVFEADAVTRVVGLPPNPAGIVPVVIQADKSAVVESALPGTVSGWVSAKVVEVGGARWLLVVGRSPSSAAVLLYTWDGAAWQPVDALGERVDRLVGATARITYKPGQTDPVRGLYVKGGADLSTIVAPDGASVSFCEGGSACVTYQYDKKWLIK
ncbi:MAG TPA: hypothetical protein VGK74_03980 [Symbiobacteriaceae bacterium]|jgi:hypothetical protein